MAARKLEDEIEAAVRRRDYHQAGRLEWIRRHGNAPPYVGGQGRDGDDVEGDGSMVLALALAAICGALVYAFIEGAVDLFGGGS